MAPAAGEQYQRNSSHLHRSLANAFHGSVYRVYHAPFDVRLPIPKSDKDTTVAQPDICIVCDPKKLDKNGCFGAPDLVAEILSPGNSSHEMRTKFDLYEASGVKECWLLEPAESVVLVYTLQGSQFVGLRPFTQEMSIESPLFPYLELKVAELFLP